MFAGEVGVLRLLKLFDKYQIKTTWFIPGILNRTWSYLTMLIFVYHRSQLGHISRADGRSSGCGT